MNTRMQTEIWIRRAVVVLGLITVANAVGTIILMIMGWPMSELLIALGLVAASGLARLLISPLNQR